MIRRTFVDISSGQVHARLAGSGGPRPVVLIHQSPGASQQMQPLMEALAPTRQVIAPDTLGNGDSSPAPQAQPTIFDLAAGAFEAIDKLVPGKFDIYGTHTGASIAMEIAIAHPDRVNALVLDGMGLYALDEQAEILDRYAREIVPDMEATHLMKVWHFCRDQHLFWPYYNRTAAGRLPNGLPDAEAFHDFTVEVIKAMRTYHHSYRAAFRHPKRDRLPLIRVPTLSLCSPSDMLWQYHPDVAALVPGCESGVLSTWDDPEMEAKEAAMMIEFLDRAR